MKFHSTEKKVTLSVREFSEFKVGPQDKRFHTLSNERARIGQAFHKSEQEKVLAEYPNNSKFEVSIKGNLSFDDWTIELNGRIDQAITSGKQILLIEVKTISRPLPQSVEEIHSKYASYFIQLACYLKLYSQTHEPLDQEINGAIQFININDETSHVVELPRTYNDPLKKQFDELRPFLNINWNAKERLKKLELKSPFKIWRDEQLTAMSEIEEANLRSKFILFEAPTGFGKTAVVLQQAMAQLHQGQVERVIYLTGKTTGQIQVINHLDLMLPKEPSLRFLRIRNREKHVSQCPLMHCSKGRTCSSDAVAQWNESGLSMNLLMEKPPLRFKEIISLSNQYSICPYEITRMLLPYNDMWIADFNYVFNPQNRSFLFSQAGFNPEKTLLIIDEAHNLASRSEDALSTSLTHFDAEKALQDLQYNDFAINILSACNELMTFLKDVTFCEKLKPARSTEFIPLIKSLDEVFKKTNHDIRALKPTTLDFLRTVSLVLKLTYNPNSKVLLWSSKNKSLSCSTVDASAEIHEAMKEFSSCIMMSASLSPLAPFIKTCGINPLDYEPVIGFSQWRENAYDVCIDTRVDTRYKSREASYQTTVETIQAFSESPTGTLVVFFPSYKYAEIIHDQFTSLYSSYNIYLQAKKQPFNQEQFIENVLKSADIVFLILGSIYSESIDTLGGKVNKAMIISPSLPLVSPVQKAKSKTLRMDGYNEDQQFTSTYKIPGINKVNQALGRFVRKPDQSAKVLLHCQRFSDSSYKELLAPEYQNAGLIETDNDLEHWLALD